MAKTREIRRRIKSIDSTKQITKAMEMVATSKIKRAEERINAARPYASKMIEIMQGLAGRAGQIQHPLLEVREPQKRTAILAVTADRGLCGAFNTNIIKFTESLIRKERSEGREVRLLTVGRKGQNYFRFMNYELTKSYLGISDQPTFEQAREIAEFLMDLYTQYEADKVVLIFNRFKSIVEQKAIEHVILPIKEEEVKEKPEAVFAEYIFEPSAQGVLSRLLPTYVEAVVYRALLESAASEQGARRTAMKAATDNAQEMIGYLRRSYNKARQAQITQEIAEIVGGAEALE
jgi:F-type H+-transporting ATPase subunit gamma